MKTRRDALNNGASTEKIGGYEDRVRGYRPAL